MKFILLLVDKVSETVFLIDVNLLLIGIDWYKKRICFALIVYF